MCIKTGKNASRLTSDLAVCEPSFSYLDICTLICGHVYTCTSETICPLLFLNILASFQLKYKAFEKQRDVLVIIYADG